MTLSLNFIWYDIWTGMYIDTKTEPWTYYWAAIPCWVWKYQNE